MLTDAGIVATHVPVFDLVPFEGTDILAARQDDEVYVPVKPFCLTLGLPYEGARKRIARDQVLREGAVMMTVPSNGGPQQQQTLPLELIPGFLMGFDANRYPPDIRDRIQVFRKRCYRALFEYFYGRGPDITSAPSDAPASSVAADIRGAAQLVAMLRAEPVGPVRTFLQDLLDRTCAVIGIQPPLVPMEAPEGPSVPERIDALLHGLQTLHARGVAYNHFGAAGENKGRIALNLPQLARLFARHDIDVQVDDALRAALFAGDRRYRCQLQTVRSRISWRHEAILCHVLQPAIASEQ